jgi:hypothetical protein
MASIFGTVLAAPATDSVTAVLALAAHLTVTRFAGGPHRDLRIALAKRMVAATIGVFRTFFVLSFV